MNTIVICIHIFVCILLIMLVLLQAGKGLGMGSSLGGSSQALFDTRRTTGILGKATTIVAIIFMVTSLTMGYTRSRGIGSIISYDTNFIAKHPDCSSENNENDRIVTEDPACVLDIKAD